jgi:hypothetical protein
MQGFCRALWPTRTADPLLTIEVPGGQAIAWEPGLYPPESLAGVAVTATVARYPDRRYSAIRTGSGLARREAAVRRSCAERLAGANALQVNQ